MVLSTTFRHALTSIKTSLLLSKEKGATLDEQYCRIIATYDDKSNYILNFLLKHWGPKNQQ